MKKILFLLLVTISSYAQTYQNPTFGTVTTKTATEVSTSNFVATVEPDGKIGKRNAYITDREKIIFESKFVSTAGLTVNGAFTIVGTGLKSPASGTFGSTNFYYPKRTDLDKDVTRAVVTINNSSSVFGLIRKPFTAGAVGGTKASINGATNTIAIYKGWLGTDTNPGVSISATIPFSLVVGKQYLLELRKLSAGIKTFSITDISNQQTFSITGNNEVDFSGSGWDYPGASFESGDITFNYFSFGSELPANGLIMFSGDSFTEGASVATLGLGSYNKRWDKFAYDALQGDAIISGKGGDTALDLLNRNDIDFFKSRYHMFLIGANDNTYSTWKTSYDAFIAKILANGQIPILVTIAPRADRQVFINTANDYIKSLGYKVINFAKAISLNNDEVTLDPALYLPDNVHPNLAGHVKLYNQLRIDFPLLFDKDNNLYNTNNLGSFTTISENNEGIEIKDGINNTYGKARMNNGRFNIFSFDNVASAYLPIVLACNASNPSPPPSPTGRVCVGTIIDDGVNQLQINGSTSTKGISSSIATYRAQSSLNRPVSVTSGVIAVGGEQFNGGNASSVDSNVTYASVEGFGISGTAGSESGGLSIYTKLSGTLTERVRFHSSGGVSIGNTTDTGAGTLNVTGAVFAPTATAGTNTTQVATTAFVTSADNLKANLAGSNSFTGQNTFTNTTGSGLLVNNGSTTYGQRIVNTGVSSLGLNLESNTGATGDLAVFTKNGVTTAKIDQNGNYVKTGGTADQALTAAGGVMTILTGSASLDFPSTAANSEANLTMTVTGAAVGDVISIGSPAPATFTTYFAFVSSTDTVTVRFRNSTVSAMDPVAATFKVKIFK